MVINEESRAKVRKLDYQALNEVLRRYVNFYSVKQSSKIEELVNIVLSGRQTGRFQERPFHCNVDPNTVIELVSDFFLDIHSEWAYRFLNVLNDGRGIKLSKDTCPYSVHFESTEDFYQYENTTTHADGSVNIVLDGTFMGVFSTMHEITHKLWMSSGQLSIIMDILAETPTLTLEFLLYEFLMSRYSADEECFDIENFMLWRFSDIIRKARCLAIECKLIEAYRNNDSGIRENDVFECLSGEENYDFIINHINKVIENGKLKYSKYIRYIIGYLFGCDLWLKLKKDSSVIKDVIKLCYLLGRDDYTILGDMEAVNSLGVQIFGSFDKGEIKSVKQIIHNKNFITLNEKTLQTLQESYARALDELFGIKIEREKKHFIVPTKK